ncbi:hypothetical protein SCALM49S_07184 [Streptomyces californicus]
MGARHFQAMEDIGTTIGLPVAAPFYDDRVLEATLAVRLPDRISPWRYKPLLVEAMRGVVPDALLARTTKDRMSSDEHQGLREHGPERPGCGPDPDSPNAAWSTAASPGSRRPPPVLGGSHPPSPGRWLGTAENARLMLSIRRTSYQEAMLGRSEKASR